MRDGNPRNWREDKARAGGIGYEPLRAEETGRYPPDTR